MNDGNKNNTIRPPRSLALIGAWLAAGLLASIANAAETIVDASTIPAYPAALNSGCSSAACADTLHAEHGLTYVSRFSFPLGNALLTREAKNELQRLLVELESFARIRHVEIIGHADTSGAENFNRWISGKRAARVQAFFAQRGVDPRKMTLRGAGSSEPLIGASDPAENRRVEIRITLQPFL